MRFLRKRPDEHAGVVVMQRRAQSRVVNQLVMDRSQACGGLRDALSLRGRR